MTYSAEALVGWIKEGLKEKMEEEVAKFHILTEEDIQFTSYYHLRKFLSNEGVDDNEYYRIYNKQYLTRAKKYPDLTIWRSGDRVALVELKHTIGRSVEEKDLTDDIGKLSIMGEGEYLIFIYTCGLEMHESDERLSRINEFKNEINRSVIVVRVALFEVVGDIEDFKERLGVVVRRS